MAVIASRAGGPVGHDVWPSLRRGLAASLPLRVANSLEPCRVEAVMGIGGHLCEKPPSALDNMSDIGYDIGVEILASAASRGAAWHRRQRNTR